MNKKLLVAVNVAVAVVLLYLFFSSLDLTELATALKNAEWVWLAPAALLYLFFSSLDLSALTTALKNAEWAWLAPAVLLYLLMNALNAVRLRWLVESLAKKKASLSRVFWVHMSGMTLSDYTPGRAGYALIVIKAREWGLKARVAARVFGVVIASDFLSRGVLAILAVALLLTVLASEALLVAGALLFVASLAVLLACSKESELVKKLLSKLPWIGKKLSLAYAQVFSREVPRSLLAKCVGISFLGALVRGVEWMLLAFALGLTGLTLHAVLLFTAFNAVLTALSFVPFSVAGLGLQEGAGALLFAAALGCGVPEAGALMLLVRLVEAGSDLIGLKEFLFPAN